MDADLFAGICVGDYAAARPWYEALFGGEPTMLPHDTEAVWEVAEHRFVYIVEDPDHAGHARLTLFTEDLDDEVGAIGGRGLEPAEDERYDNGVRKVTYRDAEGNEVGFAGSPSG